jgi:hypothetical protein
VFANSAGGSLIATVETDDAVGRTANFMSPAVKVRAHSGNRVTSAHLVEVSILNSPANPACKIIEKREHDPLRMLWLNQLERWDLLRRRVELLREYVRLLPEAMAASAPAPSPARSSFSELATS